jgi:DNA-directed RNA polymerase subunit RPC12/RpoP
MVICPKCGNKIPSRKLMLLTNRNTVACPTCSAKLQVKNKNFGRLVGASGGLIVMAIFLFYSLILPHELLFLILLSVTVVPVSLTMVAFAWIKFLKLEVKS